MNLLLRAKGVAVSPSLRKHIERRFSAALGRFSDRLDLVRVKITDVNGPRGGEDMLCRVVIRAPTGEVVVEERRDDPFAAVSRAFERTRYALSRSADKLRGRRRRARAQRA